MQETDINTTEMDDVVQSCYYYSPYANNQSQQGVDQEEQVREEEQTLSERHHKQKVSVSMKLAALANRRYHIFSVSQSAVISDSWWAAAPGF